MHVKDTVDCTRVSRHTWIYAMFIRSPTGTVCLVNTVMEAVTACNDLV